MCINDIEEIYDFVEKNNVNDICDLIIYALSPSEDIKLNWLDVLGNDKMVDLFNCKIKEKNHLYNTNLIRKYYEQFIDNCI